MQHTFKSETHPAPRETTRPRVSSGPSVEPEPHDSLAIEYAKLLHRHWIAILTCAVVGCVLALALSLFEPPQYRTRTSVDIEGLNDDFLHTHEVARTSTSGPDNNEVNQQTQIKLLQSDTLLQNTSDTLLREGERGATAKPDLLTRIAGALHLGGGRPQSYEAAVRDTAQSVKVKPLGMTRLVELTCESSNADVAARFCNQMVREFENEDISTRAEEAQKTSTWLTQQLADVKAKAEDSQRKLEQAVGGNGLMLSNQTSSTGEERLRELQGELVKAEADRMQKQADVGVNATAQADAMPRAEENPVYKQYESRLADLRGKLAELVPPLTEQNPRVIHLRSEIREAELGLAASRSTSAARQGNELSAARHREELLQIAYNAQLANVSSDLQKASQVSLLRREVESEQQLYETMLQRVKEAGLASAMQASTVRVVDPAKPANHPASPNRPADGAAGFVLAGIVGAGWFLYRDRTRRVFRVPGATQTTLQVQELGAIPHVARVSRSPLKIASRQPQLRLEAEWPAVRLGHAIESTGWDERSSIAAEAYRSTSFSLLLSDPNKGPKVYAITSADDGEGKTTVVSNLGVALSRTRLRVLLIDGDLRKPRLHTAFGMRSDFGLRNLLRGELDLNAADGSSLYRQTPVHNLAIIPAGGGSEDSVELLHSPNVARLFSRLRGEFDIILVDTPPMLHMADARVVAVRCDGGILVVRAHSTSVEQAQAARDILDTDGIPIVGSILNDFDPAREGLNNYYKSYERYQHDNNKWTAVA